MGHLQKGGVSGVDPLSISSTQYIPNPDRRGPDLVQRDWEACKLLFQKDLS